MAHIVRNPRTGCALHGGLQTIEALPGVVPILHANAGCGIQSVLNEKAFGRGRGPISGNEIFGTCSQERHVIFGGASRLREQIKNTIKVQNGRLYVVLSSCEAAMVGDDIEAMVEESVEQGNPVMATLSAGFQGDSHVGYETVFTDLLKKVPQLPGMKAPALTHEKPVVNVLGVLPATDPFWQGDIDEVREILEALGVEAHVFLNSPDALEELLQAKDADLTVVFSKWGLKPAAYLEQTYHVPVAVFDGVPSGIGGVTDFVSRLADLLPLSSENVSHFLDRVKNDSTRYLERIRDIFYSKRLNRKIFLVGEESDVTSVASVLHEYLKTPVNGVILTDEKTDPDAEESHSGNAKLRELTTSISYTDDLTEIEVGIGRSGAEVVLGSAFERRYSEQKGKRFLEIAEPVSGSIILNKSYAGIRGALRLTEDYIRAVSDGV